MSMPPRRRSAGPAKTRRWPACGDKPIRWICDDAMKFVEREERRGSRYDIILFDPPAYGRGPKGEVWQLFEDLPGADRPLPLDPDAEAARRGADRLFDPRLLLRHPCPDARHLRRHGRHGRIRRTDHPREVRRPGAVDLAVFALGGRNERGHATATARRAR